MFPGVVDISATDANLDYVRTGSYDISGVPTYCRITHGLVNQVKHLNDYPTRR